MVLAEGECRLAQFPVREGGVCTAEMPAIGRQGGYAQKQLDWGGEEEMSAHMWRKNDIKCAAEKLVPPVWQLVCSRLL